MRLLFILFITGLLHANPLREAMVLTPVSTDYPDLSISSLSIQNAMNLLNAPRKVFKVSYGDGVLTNQLEQVTMALLDYPWLADVVNSLTDEFVSPGEGKKVRMLLNVKRKNFKVVYNF